MTEDELLAELQKRKAFIVHCSRTGKGNEAVDGLFYPEDLQTAKTMCAAGNELSCSIIWPHHLETFGPVGIILKPRSTASVTSICNHDSGSSIDPISGGRISMGAQFSKQAVLSTFDNAADYNEWNVKDADTIGIFVHPTDQLDVACLCDLTDVPGYDPVMGKGKVVGSARITLARVAADFPGAPMYSFCKAEIVRVQLANDCASLIGVDPADLYR